MLQQLKYPLCQLSNAIKHGKKMKYRSKTRKLNTFYTVDFHIKFNIWLTNADDYPLSPAKYGESSKNSCCNNWSIYYDNCLMLRNMERRWNTDPKRGNWTHFIRLIFISNSISGSQMQMIVPSHKPNMVNQVITLAATIEVSIISIV